MIRHTIVLVGWFVTFLLTLLNKRKILFTYIYSHFFSRLHWHAIFGKVPVSDMCRTLIPVRLVGLGCPSGVFFFFFRFSDTAPTCFSGAGSDTYQSAVIRTALDTESYWSVPIISAGKEVSDRYKQEEKRKRKGRRRWEKLVYDSLTWCLMTEICAPNLLIFFSF